MGKPLITSNSDGVEKSAGTSAMSQSGTQKPTRNGSGLTGPVKVRLVISALIEQCDKAGIPIQVQYSVGKPGLALVMPTMTVVRNEIVEAIASNGGVVASNERIDIPVRMRSGREPQAKNSNPNADCQ